MNKSKLVKEALEYHSEPRAGKIEVVPTKPCKTQRDLSLAYTPGVAVPCLEIEKDPEVAYRYTDKGNLVAVVTNGTAVLGLGDIGALAGKPVMEGKGVLFKRFADIDVFDIELNSHNVDEIIQACRLMEPSFGGINLEDIKAPECFAVEEELKKTMKIPVFHDDQHGTAIVGGAALLNAIKVVGKKIDEIKVVINGAGASGLAIASLILNLGVRVENLIVCDTKGVIYKGRAEGMNKYKEKFAADTKCRTLAEAVKGADVLYGLSAKGAFTDDMIKSLAKNPIIMAMANPDPEITPEEARKIRSDAVIATGRSDYPNQVNNVLCFPFIFRGALDARASVINEEMKTAAAHALAELAREPVPQSVCRAYGVEKLEFGREYIIPKPFDPRALTKVSAAVAKAAMKTGVAANPIKDFDEYKARLEGRLNPSAALAYKPVKKAREAKSRIGFSAACKPAVLAAAQNAANLGVGEPVLLGKENEIKRTAERAGINISRFEIIDADKYKGAEKIADKYYQKYWRSGITREQAEIDIKNHPNRFGGALLEKGDIDCLVAYAFETREITARIVADMVDLKEEYSSVSTAAVLGSRDRNFIIADPEFYTEGDPEGLSEIVGQSLETAALFDMAPKIALISGGNFGRPASSESEDVRCALEMIKIKLPKLVIDGDMTFDTAIDPEKSGKYPLSAIKGDANILVFSHRLAADAAIRAMTAFGGFSLCARVIQGFSLPLQIADPSMESDEIAVLAAIAAASARSKAKKKAK